MGAIGDTQGPVHMLKDKPFVNVNRAGLAPNLIESELSGREKGAFTGSNARQIGPKLLKVIESGEFERLGSSRSIKVDVRVIACTNGTTKKRSSEADSGGIFFTGSVYSRSPYRP